MKNENFVKELKQTFIVTLLLFERSFVTVIAKLVKNDVTGIKRIKPIFTNKRRCLLVILKIGLVAKQLTADSVPPANVDGSTLAEKVKCCYVARHVTRCRPITPHSLVIGQYHSKTPWCSLCLCNCHEVMCRDGCTDRRTDAIIPVGTTY